MKTPRTFLLVGGLALLGPSAAQAQGVDLRPLLVNDLTGNLRIDQPLPATCDDIHQDVPLVQGHLEVAPGEDFVVVNGQILFMLTRVNLSFAPFSIHRSCVGHDETRDYTEINVSLAGAVSMKATQVSTYVYSVVIPKDKVLLHEASMVNGEVEIGDKHPKEDVTGTLDIGTGAVAFQVKVETKVHVSPDILFGDYYGTLTATVSGHAVFPDTDGDGVPNRGWALDPGTINGGFRGDNCRLVPNPDQSPVASPIIRSPGDLTMPSCFYRNLGTPMAVDLCEGGGVTVTRNAPGRLVPGLNFVTWTVQDIHQHTATATQRVTVADATPPYFFPSPPPAVSLGSCESTVLTPPAAYDDCDTTLTYAGNAPASWSLGSTVVTWTATDRAGNRATTSQTVVVTDHGLPSVACNRYISAGLYRVTASDACTAAPTIRLGPYVLANGEIIRLLAVAIPGIQPAGYDIQHHRQFRVGPYDGDRDISATDGSGNVATATCNP